MLAAWLFAILDPVNALYCGSFLTETPTVALTAIFLFVLLQFRLQLLQLVHAYHCFALQRVQAELDNEREQDYGGEELCLHVDVMIFVP